MSQPENLPALLVIDDDENLLALVSHLCKDFATVTQSHTWHDASALLSKNKYDAIVLDLVLPDCKNYMGALETIHEVSRDYPVMVVSGNLDPLNDEMDKLMRQGVIHTMAKPFDPDNFVHKIKGMLNVG